MDEIKSIFEAEERQRRQRFEVSKQERDRMMDVEEVACKRKLAAIRMRQQAITDEFDPREIHALMNEQSPQHAALLKAQEDRIVLIQQAVNKQKADYLNMLDSAKDVFAQLRRVYTIRGNDAPLS